MTDAQLINQTSGCVDYFTPHEIIEAARDCMGGIDLDPASSWEANKRVKAVRYFCESSDGLAQKWFGRVWLNHPFGRISNPLWIQKLERENDSTQGGQVEQACCITFACTSEAWFQPLLKRPQCYLCPRTNYYLLDGTIKKGVTKGSVVTYYGPYIERFTECFAHLGTVKVKFP